MENLQDNQKWVVNLDWLAFSYQVDPTAEEIENNKFEWQVPAGFQIVECEKGTNVFKSRFYVCDMDGRKKITVLCNPNSRIIDPRNCLIQFENETLYTREWLSLFDVVKQMHRGTVGNFSRVDLCCDFDKGGENYADYFQTNNWRVKGYKEGSCFYDVVRSRTSYNYFQKEIKQINWGSKSSAFKWKLYNKTREILDLRAETKNDLYKEYIVNSWRENNLNLINNNIWRLECSIVDCGKFVFENYRGDNIFTVESFHNYEPYNFIYSLLLKDKFKVVINGTDERQTLIQIPEKVGEIKRPKGVGDLVSSEILATLNRLMQMLADNMNNYHIRTKYKLFDIIREMVDTYHLEPYLIACYDTDLDGLEIIINNGYKIKIDYEKLWN